MIAERLQELAAKGYQIAKIVVTPRAYRLTYIPVLRSGDAARALYVSDDELRREIQPFIDSPHIPGPKGIGDVIEYMGLPVELEIPPNIILGVE